MHQANGGFGREAMFTTNVRFNRVELAAAVAKFTVMLSFVLATV